MDPQQTFNEALAAQEVGDLERAERLYREVVGVSPNTAAIHNNLGNVLNALGKHEEAIGCFRRALELKPDYAKAHNNLGNTFGDQGRNEEAIECYRRALKFDAEYASAHNNLGNSLKSIGKIEEAIACYRRALASKPEFADAHMNLALSYLSNGDYYRGWAEYEWRWRTSQERFRPRGFQQPLWDGGPLDEKTILIHAEQGFGDTLQFVRYLPLIQHGRKRLVFECPAELHYLLLDFPGVDELVADEKPPFDVYAPLLSLPCLLKLPDPSQSPRPPYLFADKKLTAEWKTKLVSNDFKIGINWQGNPKNPTDRHRSVPLTRFLPLAKISGVRFISLQKGFGHEQLDDCEFRDSMWDVGQELDQSTGAFVETAAVVQNLDLVITSDTALAHLAGALGRPVWVTLSAAPDWRWGVSGDKTDWYPTMRLFRQRNLGDWTRVFEKMAEELKKITAATQNCS